MHGLTPGYMVRYIELVLFRLSSLHLAKNKVCLVFWNTLSEFLESCRTTCNHRNSYQLESSHIVPLLGTTAVDLSGRRLRMHESVWPGHQTPWVAQDHGEYGDHPSFVSYVSMVAFLQNKNILS